MQERRNCSLWWDNDSFCSLFFHFSRAQVTVATLKRKPRDHIWLNPIFKVHHWTVDWSVYVLMIVLLFNSLIQQLYSTLTWKKKGCFLWLWMLSSSPVCGSQQTYIFVGLEYGNLTIRNLKHINQIVLTTLKKEYQACSEKMFAV